MYLENSIFCWIVNILIEIKVLSDHRLSYVGVGVRDGVEQFTKNHSPWERVTLQNLGGTPRWKRV